MHVVSVNVGQVREVPFVTASGGPTAFAKRPVEGPVRITEAGVEGNEVGDRTVHGDAWMRVYAYAVEDYSWWQAQLVQTLSPGHFAEQLTTSGVDLNAALVGEVWRVGTAVLQIAHVRTPCLTFKGWMGHTGYDDTAWVKRFALAARPGPYFRVLEDGEVRAGSPIEVLERPEHDVTVEELYRALMLEPRLLPRVAAVPGLKPWVYERAEAAARRTGLS